jgi:hypothetical protein
MRQNPDPHSHHYTQTSFSDHTNAFQGSSAAEWDEEAESQEPVEVAIEHDAVVNTADPHMASTLAVDDGEAPGKEGVPREEADDFEVMKPSV